MPKLTLIIPAYNEVGIIQESLAALGGALRGMNVSVVVVDNGSTDDTARIAQEAGVLVLSCPTRGKGAALQFGALHASQSEYFGFIDVDLSVDPKEVAPFLSVLERGEADIVVGSRLLNKQMVKRSALRTFSSECFNWLRRLILTIPVRDSQCGLKLMNARGRAIIAACREKGWFLDMEFLARAQKEGLVIREVAVAWDEERFADRKSKLSLVRDALLAFVAMVRIRKNI